jgi:hypothetical protein
MPVSCELEGAAVIDGLATDMSLRGSRIECAELPGFGVQVTIVVHLPGEKEASRLPATVCWTKPGCFGVRFGLLGARDTYRIADLMGRSFRSDGAR